MVGCLAVIVALLTPRLVLFFMWLFTDYLNTAFQSGWWGLLGFLFLPATTIMYAIAENEFTTATGGLQAMGIVLIVLGVVIDLGLLGGSGRGVRRSRT
jgi:hypothetical protein